MNILSPNNWDLNIHSPIQIAGPCSVESEQQVLQTALQLKDANIHLLRGGIWKPRTRPNSFEGMGKQALPWLKAAGNAIGKPVCTEVAKAAHVYEALRNEIDVLWIGARTTANPFAVQEIADALKGVDIPVMIKNPVNPDLNLWIGAIERIYQSGINKIAVIHRGFSTYKKIKYRNNPQWEIPLELRRAIPDIPIICDPSHLTGKPELIPFIAQKSYDLDMDGLMIETHIQPSKALSDAAQQITPKEYIRIINHLVIRKNHQSLDESQIDKLAELRTEIDGIDERIIQLISERMKVADKIGLYKSLYEIKIYQPERWEFILKTRGIQAKSGGLNEAFVKDFLDAIHKESIRHQTDVMNN